MKSHQTTKKLGKRTFTLKELAQRDFSATSKEAAENLTPVFNLVNIQEDLLNDGLDKRQLNYGLATASSTDVELGKHPKTENIALPINLINQLIQKEITKTAKNLDLEEAELQAWINLQVMAPKQTLLTLLRLAREYQLDPLKEEVALALYEDANWQAYITVEGYSKILNNHPAFDGISFTQSAESTNGIPIWMECVIYRKDHIHPTVVREYYDEVKGDQAIWQRMPRRMLRHRVLQQCARLIIGSQKMGACENNNN